MLKVKINPNGIAPTKGHVGDAGWDVYTPVDFTLWNGESIKVNLNLIIIGEPGKVYKVEGKSGLASKHAITTIGNIIDNGYRGEIHVIMHNLGMSPVVFKRGEKIAQILVQPVEDDDNLEIVDEVDETSRGDNGFGSTGA